MNSLQLLLHFYELITIIQFKTPFITIIMSLLQWSRRNIGQNSIQIQIWCLSNRLSIKSLNYLIKNFFYYNYYELITIISRKEFKFKSGALFLLQ